MSNFLSNKSILKKGQEDSGNKWLERSIAIQNTVKSIIGLEVDKSIQAGLNK